MKDEKVAKGKEGKAEPPEIKRALMVSDLTAIEYLAAHAPDPPPGLRRIRDVRDLAKWSVEWATLVLEQTRGA